MAFHGLMPIVAFAAALLDPAAFTERAPDTFKASFDTTAGSFVIEVRRDLAPNGADRFYNLVKSGFYDGNRFYRVTPLMAEDEKATKRPSAPIASGPKESLPFTAWFAGLPFSATLTSVVCPVCTSRINA